MQGISFCLSILGLIVLISASLIKGEKMKATLLLVFSGNFLVALSYVFALDGINGAVSSFIGATQAIVNYFFNAKNKPIPIWLIVVYALSFVAVNVAVLTSAVGILAIMATLCFVGCVLSKSGKGYRIWQATNCALWIIYDILTKSYAPLVTHAVLCTFTVIGILINDLKKKQD